VQMVGPVIQDVEVMMVFLEDRDYPEIQVQEDRMVLLERMEKLVCRVCISDVTNVESSLKIFRLSDSRVYVVSLALLK